MDRHLSRRRALTQVGLGGLAAALVVPAPLTSAQQGTPVDLPRTVPTALEPWVSGWESLDPQQIASVYAPDAVVEIVPFGAMLQGREAIEGYFTAYFGAFAAATSTIRTVFATEANAGAEWVFAGRYTGQLPGLPPGDGQDVASRGANIMVLRDGQIAEERIYTDLAGLLMQTGGMDTAPAATPAG